MSGQSVWLLGGGLCLFGSGAGAVPTLTTLYTFHGPDGAVPHAPLAMDQDGNLYGTTIGGGPGTSVDRSNGNGVLFELSGYNHFKFRTVMAFDGLHRGATFNQLVFDKNNDIFGTTITGSVFEVSGDRHQKTRTLTDVDGVTGLVFDAPGTPFRYDVPYKTGDLIGSTETGGANGNGGFFSLSGDDHQTFTSLYDFAAGPSYPGPGGPMIADACGNLYGTTFGGYNGIDNGTVFELSGPGHRTFTTLASFDYVNTGANPNRELVLDRFGNLYGTTTAGGSTDNGTIFELTGPDHRQLISLYSFGEQGGPDGADPSGPLAIDAVGNIFGEASVGGINGERLGTLGVIYELSHGDQTYSVLYRFTGYADGYYPSSGLISDKSGNLYGMTEAGGLDYGEGIIFKLSNTGFVLQGRRDR